MMDTWQVVLAGEGGQGLIVGGRLLARAAILEGKRVVQTQSYGISARGGYSEAQVVISTNPIHYPQCTEPDVVLALTQAAYNKYVTDKKCLIIYDEDAVTPKRQAKDIAYPFNKVVLELGKANLINMLFLGVLIKHASILKPENILLAIKEQFPKYFTSNATAFQRGFGAQV